MHSVQKHIYNVKININIWTKTDCDAITENKLYFMCHIGHIDLTTVFIGFLKKIQSNLNVRR